MPYMTRLITVTHFENITDDLKPFVEFQAAQKKIAIEPKSRVAILQVENIPSYHVIFLDTDISFDDIIQELESQELQLSEDTKTKFIQLLQNR